MDDALEAAAALIRDDKPHITDAIKSFTSVIAANDLTSSASAATSGPPNMAHPLLCAKACLRQINERTLMHPSEWAELHAQGEDETAMARIESITDYKACHLLAAQVKSTAGAKVTKLLGRKFLRATRCWDDEMRGATAAALAAQRIPEPTVASFLEGWSRAISGEDADASLVWAVDFQAALQARTEARTAEVAERRERMDAGEDEAERLRAALGATAEEEAPRIVEVANAAVGPDAMCEEFLRRFVPEFREAWLAHDRTGDGSLAQSDLRDALRSIGHQPTLAALDEMVNVARAESAGCERFPEFAAIVGRKLMQAAARGS